jgi:hypothetical protein
MSDLRAKNIGLVTASFLLGLGSAVGSVCIPENVYVRAKLKSDPSGETQCVDTGIQCDATGLGVCIVTIPISGGISMVATNSVKFRPYRGSDCQVQLTGMDGGGDSSVSIIDRLAE